MSAVLTILSPGANLFEIRPTRLTSTTATCYTKKNRPTGPEIGGNRVLYIAESAENGDIHTITETLDKDEALEYAKAYVAHLTPSERLAASVVVLGYDIKLKSINEWKHCTDEDAEDAWEDWREDVLSWGAVDVVEIDHYRITQPQHSPYHPEVFGTIQDAVEDANWRIPDYVAEYDDDMDDCMDIEILDKHDRVVAVRRWNAAAKKYDDWRLY